MLFNRNNLLAADYQSHSSIRPRPVLGGKTPHLLLTAWQQTSVIKNQPHESKREIDRQSPIPTRRRPTIDTLRQPSDMNDVLGNQLQLTLPPQFTTQSKSPRISLSHSPPLNDSKHSDPSTTKHIPFDPKLAHSLPIPTWTPMLKDEKGTPTRILHTKKSSVKHYRSHQQRHVQTNRDQLGLKQHSVANLYISSRSFNTNSEVSKKTLLDTWEAGKSNAGVSFDSEETMPINRNSPVLSRNPPIRIQEFHGFDASTFNQHLLSALSRIDNLKFKSHKQTNFRRLSYSITLAPVVEQSTDDDIIV